MIVCVCHNINDTQLKKVIETGARTVRDVERRCKAGGDCGACVCDIRRMLRGDPADNVELLDIASK